MCLIWMRRPFGVRMCDACFDERTMEHDEMGELAGSYLPDEFMAEDLWELAVYTK